MIKAREQATMSDPIKISLFRNFSTFRCSALNFSQIYCFVYVQYELLCRFSFCLFVLVILKKLSKSDLVILTPGGGGCGTRYIPGWGGAALPLIP